MIKLTTEEFICKAIIIHGNLYNYNLVNYINSKTKVIIICPIHDKFLQTPNNHLRGDRCPKCFGNKLIDTKVFTEISVALHGLKYDYKKVIYTTYSNKVIITCDLHGEFLQSPADHLSGKGCKKCGYNKLRQMQSYGVQTFANKSNSVHNFKYNYLEVDYINNKTKVKIICLNHGEFLQTPENHLKGVGCPRCKSSKGENKIYNWLTFNNIKFVSQYKFMDCRNINPLPFDFYIPDYNLLIEYDGKQHYIENNRHKLKYIQNNDNIKNNYCDVNNIKLLRIPYTEFNNVEIVLDNIFGENCIKI